MDRFFKDLLKIQGDKPCGKRISKMRHSCRSGKEEKISWQDQNRLVLLDGLLGGLPLDTVLVKKPLEGPAVFSRSL